jgi:hypothetical protein
MTAGEGPLKTGLICLMLLITRSDTLSNAVLMGEMIMHAGAVVRWLDHVHVAAFAPSAAKAG